MPTARDDQGHRVGGQSVCAAWTVTTHQQQARHAQRLLCAEEDGRHQLGRVAFCDPLDDHARGAEQAPDLPAAGGP